MIRRAFSLLWVLLLLGCRVGARQVVVYTSVDQVYAEPVLQAFEEETGIRVLAVYDVEATKTVGLAQRLLAEKARPQADVFWNGEFAQTMALKAVGVLAPTHSAAATDLPADHIDPEGYWIAFGGRARVILVNADRVAAPDLPSSIFDLLTASEPGRVALASPLFGTTSTQAAALYAELGGDPARAFYQQVVARGVRVLDGNSVVRDQVANGQLDWGLTDTDDACGAITKGAPVTVIFPDQGEGEIGTLVVPNTVALIAGGPNPEAGQALVDYLVSAETEARLVESNWIQIPARPLPAGSPATCFAGATVRGMDVGFEAIFHASDAAQGDLQTIFVR